MRSIVATVALVAVALGASACGDDDGGTSAETTTSSPAGSTTSSTSATPAPIAVTSEAFNDGEQIPVKYTCEGENVSPGLDWTGVPFGASSLAVVVDDPDAPGGTFVHWVVVNLSIGTNALIENASQVEQLEQLANGTGEAAWTGPCPPPGPAHHYRFTVYALPGGIQATDTAAALETIERTAIARGTLTGTYER
jgi:Raf kinase inhibitor-like YbhB/YbcL family protein